MMLDWTRTHQAWATTVCPEFVNYIIEYHCVPDYKNGANIDYVVLEGSIQDHVRTTQLVLHSQDYVLNSDCQSPDNAKKSDKPLIRRWVKSFFGRYS